MTSPAPPSADAVGFSPRLNSRSDDLSALDPEVIALVAAVRAQGVAIADPTVMPLERARKLAERYHG
ncbi:hypothetical protein JZU48_05030, partial [bacterium]|nr:hypothetical protein [bacterium]